MTPVCSLCLTPEERASYRFAATRENCTRCKKMLTIGRLPKTNG